MTLKNQAIQTALEGDWQTAIALNKILISQDPQDIDALNRLAFAYSITGKIKEAKSSYLKVLKIDPLNPIAIRNLKKIKDRVSAFNGSGKMATFINNKFLEEPGKTKVVELINIAQPKIIENLRTGQSLELNIKRLKIFVQDEKQYIGVLPDDIARRLIRFIKGGCTYDAYVKSANQHKVTVFVKELKKVGKYKDLASFTLTSDTPLALDKNGKIRAQVENQRVKDQENEDNYSEEE